MNDNDTPWSRVAVPAPLPARPTADMLLAYGDVEFAELIRDNMLPPAPPQVRKKYRRADGPRPTGRQLRALHEEQMARFGGLWRVIRDEPEVTERVIAVLEDFAAVTVEALDRLDGYGAHEQRRIRKFSSKINDAWDHLNAKPRRWVDPASVSVQSAKLLASFNAPGRRAVLELAAAVTAHREAVTASGRQAAPEDEDLWAVLRALGLEEIGARAHRRDSQASR